MDEIIMGTTAVRNTDRPEVSCVGSQNTLTQNKLPTAEIIMDAHQGSPTREESQGRDLVYSAFVTMNIVDVCNQFFASPHGGVGWIL
jgi:hypothetical protein